MTRSERERQIERYISGGMSPAEEQDFFIQAALEKELRLELKALVTVDSAIRKDREAEPAEHTALRSRVAAMLAAAPPAQDPAASAVPRPAAPGAGAPAGGAPAATVPAAAALQRILPIQWISLAAATIALTAVLFLIFDRPATPAAEDRRYQRNEQFQGPQQAPAAAPAAQGKDAAPVPAPSAAGSPGAVPATPDAPSRQMNAGSASESVRQGDGAAQKMEQRTSATDPSGSPMVRRNQSGTALTRQQNGSDKPASALAEEEADEVETLGPSKRGSDTLSVGVKIRMKGKKQQ